MGKTRVAEAAFKWLGCVGTGTNLADTSGTWFALDPSLPVHDLYKFTEYTSYEEAIDKALEVCADTGRICAIFSVGFNDVPNGETYYVTYQDILDGKF